MVDTLVLESPFWLVPNTTECCMRASSILSVNPHHFRPFALFLYTQTTWQWSGVLMASNRVEDMAAAALRFAGFRHRHFLCVAQ